MITCEIDLSNRCQNGCSFCMFKEYRKAAPVDLNHVVCYDLLYDLKAMGVRSITFTGGGEPTLHPRFESIVNIAKAYEFELGLITNGITLAEHDEDFYKQFRFVRISLDAGTKETYAKIKSNDAFDEVMSYLYTKRLQSVTQVGVSYVVCEENKDEIRLAQSLVRGRRIRYIQFKPVHGTEIELGKIDKPHNNDETIQTVRYKVASTLPCHIAGLVGIVGADANVWYCCQKRGVEKYRLGNLGESPMAEIWARREDIKPNIEECTTCRYANYVEELYNPTIKKVQNRWFL